MDVVDQVLSWFGKVIIIGGSSAGVAFLLFQYLGKGWIDARFAERLEAFKHEQAKELQRLKVEVESVLSGTLKMQEREFTVLPEAWNKLSDAYSYTANVTSPLQSYADLQRMDSAELNEFLAETKLRETQKDKIRSAKPNERNELFQNQIFWTRLTAARQAVGSLQQYIVTQGVFLPTGLKSMFAEMHTLLRGSLTKVEIGHEHREFKMQTEAWEDVSKKAEPLHGKIEKAIEERLHAHTKA